MKKGISLIVLVITIIVMIILAASVVISLSNTGIIDKANTAVQLTNEQQVQELASLTWMDKFMENYRGSDLEREVKEALEDQGVKSEDWDIQVSDTGVVVTSKLNGSVEDEEGYLSGTWVFADDLGTIGADEGMSENITFKINLNGQEMTFCGINVGIVLMGWSSTGIEMAYMDDGTYGEHYVEYSGYWIDEDAKTITFTHKQQVSSEFYAWFTAKATKVS